MMIRRHILNSVVSLRSYCAPASSGRTPMVHAEGSGEVHADNSMKVPGEVPMLQAEFTCNVCKTRQAKRFSRHAYEKGVVIVRCDGCKNNHLFADHLGWIKEGFTTVEDFLARRGDTVRRGVRMTLPEVTAGELPMYVHIEGPVARPSQSVSRLNASHVTDEQLASAAEILAHRYAARDPMARGVVSFVDLLLVLRPWVRHSATLPHSSILLEPSGAVRGVLLASEATEEFPPHDVARGVEKVPYFARGPWVSLQNEARRLAVGRAAGGKVLMLDWLAVAAKAERKGEARSMLQDSLQRAKAAGFTHAAAVATHPAMAKLLLQMHPSASVLSSTKLQSWAPPNDPDWTLFSRTVSEDFTVDCILIPLSD